jgi:hypothetical protein
VKTSASPKLTKSKLNPPADSSGPTFEPSREASYESDIRELGSVDGDSSGFEVSDLDQNLTQNIAWTIALTPLAPAVIPTPAESQTQLVEFAYDDADSDVEILRSLTEACDGVMSLEEQASLELGDTNLQVTNLQVPTGTGMSSLQERLVLAMSHLVPAAMQREVNIRVERALSDASPALWNGAAQLSSIRALLSGETMDFQEGYLLDTWCEKLISWAIKGTLGQEPNSEQLLRSLRSAGIHAFGLRN